MAIARFDWTVLDRLTGDARRKIAHNTWVRQGSHAGEFVFTYHGTDIATVNTKGGAALITTGGYDTVTTTGRLDEILRHFGIPFHVVRRDWTARLIGESTDEAMGEVKWHIFEGKAKPVPALR